VTGALDVVAVALLAAVALIVLPRLRNANGSSRFLKGSAIMSGCLLFAALNFHLMESDMLRPIIWIVAAATLLWMVRAWPIR
jgi:hypothetical protein